MTFSLYAYNTAELQPEENARSSLLFPSPNKKPGSLGGEPGFHASEGNDPRRLVPRPFPELKSGDSGTFVPRTQRWSLTIVSNRETLAGASLSKSLLS